MSVIGESGSLLGLCVTSYWSDGIGCGDCSPWAPALLSDVGFSFHVVWFGASF